MPMTPQQSQSVLSELAGSSGLPAGFGGDRLAAYAAGLQRAVEVLAQRVTLDPPAPPKAEKPPKPEGKEA